MQKYKFRGKRIDNGEWVYGNGIVVVGEDYAAIPQTKDVTSKDYAIRLCKVIPETVGMYTGFADVDGKEIYPGDIFGDPIQLRCVVEQMANGEYRLSFLDKRITSISICDHKVEKSRILGNAHDNPELVTPKQIANS